MYNIINADGHVRYADIIYKLEKECFPGEYWSCEAIAGELNKENTYFMIAYDDDKIVGYFCFSFLLGEAELERICVLPEYRRKGAGSEMLSFAIDYLKEHEDKIIMINEKQLKEVLGL